MAQPQVPPHRLPVIEIVQTVNSVASVAEGGVKVLNAVSASEAFSKYNWLKNVPVFNSSGNLRGMVISSDWRVVFDVSSDALETMGNITLVAGFAANIANQWDTTKAILNSNDSRLVKGLRLATVAGTASERTLGGAVSSGASLIFQSLQGYCMLAGLAGGTAQSYSKACVAHLQGANHWVQTQFNTWSDTTKQGELIYHVMARLRA